MHFPSNPLGLDALLFINSQRQGLLPSCVKKSVTKEGTQRLIRLSKDLVLYRDLDPCNALLIGLPHGLFAVEEMESPHLLLTKAAMLCIDNSIEMVVHSLQATKRDVASDLLGAECALNESIKKCIEQAFTLGRFQGYEHGRQVMRKLTGFSPRCARLYEFDEVQDIGGSTNPTGPNYVTLGIRLESHDCRLQEHNDYMFSLFTFCRSLKLQLNNLVKMRLKFGSLLPNDFTRCDGPTGYECLDNFIANDDATVCNYACIEELREKINLHVQDLFVCVWTIGEATGFDHGQLEFKREYGYPMWDDMTYSLDLRDGRGIKVSKSPIACTCVGMCTECIHRQLRGLVKEGDIA